MQDIIKEYLGQVKIGRKQSFKNLAAYPLLSTYAVPVDYLTLDEALTGNVLDIVEVDTDGSVPDLKVKNNSARMILILDREELVGAKQNRIVNTTILVMAKSSLIIPVSCVEHGRWSYESTKFSSQERMMSSNLRAMKAEQVHNSIRTSREFRSNQGAIWDSIAEKADRMEAQCPTGAMSSIYEKEMPTIQEYLTHFRLINSQVGAIFLINGKVVGLDSFGKPETFSKIFKKLVQSYTLDAIDWLEPEKEHKALKSPVTRFLKAAQNAGIEKNLSVGQGTDYRLESEKITGFALALDDKILHLSVFERPDQRNESERVSSMRRYSARRRNRL